MALEFLILPAGRSGEVRGALRSEIDLEAKLWIIPAERMKAGREHRVPLCDRAVEILERAAQLRVNDYVFHGDRRDQPLSSMAFEMLLRRMKVEVTAHGFRSSLRDWAGEATAFPREVAEAALAHQVGNAVELAYRRGDALAKRRELMTAWGGSVSWRRQETLWCLCGDELGEPGAVVAGDRSRASSAQRLEQSSAACS